MTVRTEYQTKLTPEGRVLIPGALRRALGLHPGDRVQLVLDGDVVRVMSAKSMAEALWAQNQGGDGGDAVNDVRAERNADAVKDAEAWDCLDRDLDCDEDAIAARILADLG